MKLNEKVLAFLLLFFITTISVILIAGASFYLDAYVKLDERGTVSTIHNVVNSLNTSRSNDLRVLTDWAIWDDTYEFIQSPEQSAFIERNLLPETFSQLGVTLFVISDLNGTVIWGRTYNEEKKTLEPLSMEVLAHVNAINGKMAGSRMGETDSGIILAGSKPLIIGTAPVTHTNGSGPVAGRLILGSPVNTGQISQFVAVSSPSVAILPAGDPQVPEAVRSRLFSVPQLNPVAIIEDETSIRGYVLLDDFFNQPALIITTYEERTFFRQGLSSLINGIFVFLVISALLGSSTLILADRFVLRRLRLLRDAADEIRTSGTLSGQVDVGGDDELRDVAVAFNKMIRTIGDGQKELTESREYLDRIFTSVKAGIMVVDAATHRIIDINPSAAEMIGLPRHEIIGKVCQQYICPTAVGACPITDLNQTVDNAERILVRADGTELSVIKYVIRLNIGGRDSLLETFIDNTGRKRIENALRESEEKFRNLAENTADVLFSIDLEGNITYVSPQVARYGFTPDKLVNRSFISLIHPDDAQRIAMNITAEIASGANFTSTFRIIDKSGMIFWVEERSNILYDERKRPRGMQGVIRDITDRKRAEDAIRLANRKLNLLNEITRHDIINTLTGLLGTADMALDPSMKADRDIFLADIRQLAVTIQNQIEFTREYQAVGIKEPVWQNVHEIISRAAEPYAGSSVTIINDISAIEVFADPLLEKVFYNLIQNAVSYGKKITTIRFTERISDRGFAIVCEDDGTGIPPEMKEKIFARGIGQHSGMGLFLSREILAITGITIKENGISGKGARFEMVIPKGGYRFT